MDCFVLDNCDEMNKIIPKIWSVITRTTRQEIIPEWSDKSWIHNVFRLYEMVFGRRVGIRPEMSSAIDENGIVTYACHSLESALALGEQYIREFLTSLRWKPFRIYIPILQTPQNIPVFASPYLFAIAFDATTEGDGGTAWITSTSNTYNWSHTSTGSNRLLVVGVTIYSTTGVNSVSGITYPAGTSLTKINSIAATLETANQSTELWRLVAPATGANTITVTLTINNLQYNAASAMSYSGVNQTSPIDSNNTGQSLTNAASFSLSTTVVASNCWLTGYVFQRGGALTAGTGTTLRSPNTGSVTAGSDSNATVGTGSQSLAWTATSQTWPGCCVASIAPLVASTVNSNFFAFM